MELLSTDQIVDKTEERSWFKTRFKLKFALYSNFRVSDLKYILGNIIWNTIKIWRLRKGKTAYIIKKNAQTIVHILNNIAFINWYTNKKCRLFIMHNKSIVKSNKICIWCDMLRDSIETEIIKKWTHLYIIEI